jgi:transcription antitermination factor NusG
VPLFAGYLFVQHDPRESWTPIRTTPGVRAMLRNGHQLQYASEASVSVLQAGEDARRTTPTSPVAQLAPGASVAVLDGPFRGRQGAIVAISHDRAVVSVMVFGRLQDVHMPVASLVPTGEIV